MCEPLADCMEDDPSCGMLCEVICCHPRAVQVPRGMVAYHYNLRDRCCLDCGIFADFGDGDSFASEVISFLYNSAVSACYITANAYEFRYQDSLQNKRPPANQPPAWGPGAQAHR